MRASVLFEPRTPLKVEELELEAPREGEVLVRMTDEANEAFRALAAGELARGLIVF